MIILTADGWGKNGLRKAFYFPAVLITWSVWQRWSGYTFPRTCTRNFLWLSLHSLSTHLCRIECLNFIFLEICEAWELFSSTDVFRYISGPCQAGFMYIHFTCISALLGTEAIAPWKGPPRATAERVDSDKESCASCRDMHHRIQGIWVMTMCLLSPWNCTFSIHTYWNICLFFMYIHFKYW